MSNRINKYICSGIDDFGKGIVKTKDLTFFVDNFLPGEEGKIETSFSYGKIKSAKLKNLLTSSKDRIKPICPYYNKCGGCSLMHLTYDKQLEYKKEKVHNLIKKIGKLDFKINDVIPCNLKKEFRTKTQKPFGIINKRPCLGYYRENSHEIVPITNCLIEKNISNKISNTILKLISKFKYKVYDEDTGNGTLKHLLIKVSSKFNEVLVTLVVKDANLKGIKEFAKELILNHNEIKGVVLNINPRHTNVILGEKEISIYGKNYIKDQIFDNIFTISSSSFYQTNSEIIETLYKQVIDLANFNNNDTILDAYCGTGTIGISCSKYVRKVIGVEINKSAINDAIYNVKRNNINNCTFICEDATEYILKSKEKYDVIILDPPRKGTTREFIDACLTKSPKKIIYVSCDVSTLARDLSYFSKNYSVNIIQPIDMFPYSYHVETVCLLTKK